jgi:hypothetical protein
VVSSVNQLQEGIMNTKNDQEEATLLLADYEPIASEFREHALMEWRTEEKEKAAVCVACTGKLYGLPWKYVRFEVEE